jgi:hypothetical protein
MFLSFNICRNYALIVTVLSTGVEWIILLLGYFKLSFDYLLIICFIGLLSQLSHKFFQFIVIFELLERVLNRFVRILLTTVLVRLSFNPMLIIQCYILKSFESKYIVILERFVNYNWFFECIVINCTLSWHYLSTVECGYIKINLPWLWLVGGRDRYSRLISLPVTLRTSMVFIFLRNILKWFLRFLHEPTTIELSLNLFNSFVITTRRCLQWFPILAITCVQYRHLEISIQSLKPAFVTAIRWCSIDFPPCWNFISRYFILVAFNSIQNALNLLVDFVHVEDPQIVKFNLTLNGFV